MAVERCVRRRGGTWCCSNISCSLYSLSFGAWTHRSFPLTEPNVTAIEPSPGRASCSTLAPSSYLRFPLLKPPSWCNHCTFLADPHPTPPSTALLRLCQKNLPHRRRHDRTASTASPPSTIAQSKPSPKPTANKQWPTAHLLPTAGTRSPPSPSPTIPRMPTPTKRPGRRDGDPTPVSSAASS